jgi:hypothetical protein
MKSIIAKVLLLSFFVTCGFYGENVYSMQKVARQKFTQEEDKQLTQLVGIFGTNDWKRVAKGMGNRNARQCRERYVSYLDPNINKDPWTKEENDHLMQLHEQHGNKWKKMAKHFNGRTPLQAKNQYLILCNRNTQPASFPIAQRTDQQQSDSFAATIFLDRRLSDFSLFPGLQLSDFSSDLSIFLDTQQLTDEKSSEKSKLEFHWENCDE